MPRLCLLKISVGNHTTMFILSQENLLPLFICSICVFLLLESLLLTCYFFCLVLTSCVLQISYLFPFVSVFFSLRYFLHLFFRPLSMLSVYYELYKLKIWLLVLKSVVFCNWVSESALFFSVKKCMVLFSTSHSLITVFSCCLNAWYPLRVLESLSCALSIPFLLVLFSTLPGQCALVPWAANIEHELLQQSPLLWQLPGTWQGVSSPQRPRRKL